MVNQNFAQYLAKLNADRSAQAAANGWTYTPETVEEWAKLGVYSAGERNSWWRMVEEQEEIKERRKNW